MFIFILCRKTELFEKDKKSRPTLFKFFALIFFDVKGKIEDNIRHKNAIERFYGDNRIKKPREIKCE